MKAEEGNKSNGNKRTKNPRTISYLFHFQSSSLSISLLCAVVFIISTLSLIKINMGNDFAKPSAKNILNVALFEEYTNSKLSDVKEASSYLGGNTACLSPKQFEDAFSVLFKDCDQHFAVFEKEAVLSQLPASLREDDHQRGGTVNPFMVCTIVALLSKDNVDKKFTYLYELHFNNTNPMEDNIRFITNNIFQGIMALFKMAKVPSREMQVASVLASLKTVRHSQRLQSERDTEHTNTNENKLTVDDFFQLCQESQAISKILNAILQLCSRQQVVQAENAITQLETKLLSAEIGKTEKVRHALWNFCIMDMFNESWLASTPQVANTRTVSSCIELFLYSGKQALPVYFNPHTAVFDAADASLITFDTKKNIMRVNDMNKTENDASEGDGFLADSYQLQGIIDEYTIMLWFAECCPANVTEKSKIERKSVVEMKDGRRRSSLAVATYDRRSSSAVSQQGRSSLMFAVPQLGGRARRTSFNSAIGSQWRDMGVQFTTTTMANILKQFVANPNAKKGHKSNFKCAMVKDERPDSALEDTGDDLFNDHKEDKEEPKLRCEVSYTVHDIFQTDQFLYNVVEMIARGYRNVPLAASRTRPYVVSHIISSVDVACFLRLYSKECLRKMATTTVLDSGLMKMPLVIAVDMNYGSAIQHLKQFKVDTAAIIDTDGRWVGRLDCRSAGFMWWRWKSLAKGVLGDQAELDMLRDRFSHETYNEFDVSSIKNFSAFSMMMNPLRECTAVGIIIYNFEDQFKAPPADKHAFAEDEGEEDSDDDSSKSSNSNSSSSDSASSSGSSSSDSEEDDDKVGDMSKMSKLSMSVASTNTASVSTTLMSAKDKELEAKRRHKLQFTDWLRAQGLLLENDTIASALEVMSLFKTTKAFVVNAFGEVIGVVSIRSIAIEILKSESIIQKDNYLKGLEEDKVDD